MRRKQGVRVKPNWKVKGRDGFQIIDRSRFKINGNDMWLEKVGWIKISRKGGNPYGETGTARSLSVFQRGRRWYATVCL